MLLIVLLPGVLFFAGLYIPERFTRETAQRSPLGQLAGVLLIAFAIHGTLYALSGAVCGTRSLPCVDLVRVLQVVNFGTPGGPSAAELAGNIARFRWAILGYVLLTSALGIGAGALAGGLTARGWRLGIGQHTWLYDLRVGDDYTVAYVLTNVKEGPRVLMYRGFLKAFGLRQDGRFSYLVLTDVVRYFLHLEGESPRTSDRREWRLIGASAAEHGADPVGHKLAARRRARTYLVIEGEDVANVVFDRLEFDADAVLRQLEALVGSERGDLQAALLTVLTRATGERPRG